MNKFWIEDPSTLFSEKTYISIIPTNDMNLNEKLNSITRLCIYYIIIGFIFNFKDLYIYTTFSIIILIIIVYNINNSNKLDINNIFNKDEIEKLSKDLSPVVEKNILNKCNISESNILENVNSDKCNITADSNITTDPNITTDSNITADSNNITTDTIINPDIHLDSINTQNCKKPTKDNPLMNINIGDDPTNNPACIHTDEIKEDINSKFNYNLYRDTDDLFERFNSQRQFYTTPNTSVPNDQTKFAEWLYKTPPTCKENSLCLKYEDTRFYK